MAKRGEKKAERLDEGADMEAGEENISCSPRKVVEENLNSVKMELKKKKKNRYNLAVSSQLTPKELGAGRERVEGEE